MDMKKLTNKVLLNCIHGASSSDIDKYYDHLIDTFQEFDITNINRIAMFIAQVGHESHNFKFVTENLNYSGDRLLVVFPKYFKGVDVSEYSRNPEKIANRVYSNRLGNGDEDSGDGYRFIGRGLIQLTGRDNYSRCGKALGVDLLVDPEYLQTPNGAVRSAGWFWETNKLNTIADKGDIVKCTKIINGGNIGLDDRTKRYELAISVLKELG